MSDKETGKEQHLLLHLSSDEDIGWIVRVLYYIEEVYPSFKPIESWEDYLAEKAKKEGKAIKN